MGLLFKNGTIVTASDTVEGDLLVEGEIITLIGKDIDPAGHEVVDCAGKYLMPGGIDVHTHLELPFGGTISNDDFDTGHMAAAFGGTTCHIDFVIQPIGGSLHDGLRTWREKAKIAQIDYGFHMAVTDLNDAVMEEIPTMVNEGITSLKLFMAYKNVFQVDDATLYNTMRIAAEHGMIVMVHAENGDVEASLTPALLAEGKTEPYYHAKSRPPEIEGEATNRAVTMAGLTNCPLYVVHMTCEPAISALRRGRAMGYPVMGETCTQYLFLTADDHLGAPGFEGSKYVCSPPIRTRHDHEVLWQAVRDGSLQAISTDHCNFWFEGEATNRAVIMAGLTNCPLYVVHMTCEPAISALRRGRAMGYPVMGETCTQYLFLTADDHLGAPGFEGSKYVCSPPIRTRHDHEVLWQAVRDGSLQAISTDHCNFWFEGGKGPWKEWAEAHNGGDWVEFESQDPSYRRPGKELGKGNFAKIPNGMPGLEERMMVIWEHGVNKGRFSANRFVELNCTNPAKIFGMYPRKGTLSVGSDADIAVWDPEAQHILSVETTHMRTDYIVYEGWPIKGKPVKVYQRGNLLVDGDNWHGKNGAGQYIARQPYAPVL